MTVRIEVGYRAGFPDPRGLATLETIRSFLGIPADNVRSFDVYLIDATLSDEEADAVRQRVADPVTQRSAIGRLAPEPFDFAISVGFRPGVTDAVGKSALALVGDVIGRPMPPDAAVYTSRIYFVSGVDRAQADAIAGGLLANALIERFEVTASDRYLATAPDRSVPAVRTSHRPVVETISLQVDDEALLRISRDRILSLSLNEMKAIQGYFAREDVARRRADRGLPRDPTDVEIECLAQTWSEHCKHKIFNATIEYTEPGLPPTCIRSLFKTCIRDTTDRIRRRQIEQGGTWLVSVFHDNAGVIAFDEKVHVVYKVETHNSPSALDPYGGAMTGIVGVNRDPFGTGLGSDLLCNVWGYCFADPRHGGPVPQGLMHPRRVRDGVHRGVVEGGNQSGIPYARGWELFDSRYLGKPLVFCGTVGRMPIESAGRPTHVKSVRPGDRIVMCGGRIGKDGIHGATFSSAELDESSPVQAVQIGDPITQKKMFDFLSEARELGLYSAITDNGAGGLSSSVGELCMLSGGAMLDLAHAPLKYAGLDPWEILISEAQERMTLAVPPDKLQQLLDLARRREVEATDLGEFTASGELVVRYGDRLAACLPLDFLHEGVPEMRLTAEWNPPVRAEPVLPPDLDAGRLLEALLRRPNLASNEKKCRSYDHEVKGLTVVRPFVGARSDVPSDASVFLVRHGSRRGIVLSEGVNPFYSDIDTRWMTASVIDEAVRKAVGAGARLDHMAGLDNYCWPDPVQSDKTPDGRQKLAQLVRSTLALAEFCDAYGVPCISGKDSMKNDSTMGGVKISIPPTLLFSVIAVIEDVTLAVTMDVKEPGAVVYVLGVTRDELGGSELMRELGLVSTAVPRVDPRETVPLYEAVQRAIREELLQSCHSPVRGGLAVALARTAMGGELGLDVDLDLDPHLRALAWPAALFSESNGRYVVSVAPDRVAAFEACLHGCAFARVGAVTAAPRLVVRHGNRVVVDADVLGLKAAWKETLDAV
jgi:phosphoribosylformylglycinamidine synthase II